MPVLAMTAEVRELRERVRDLMDRLVYPNEPRLDREDDEAEALVGELRAEVRAAGLWAPHIGPEAGGSGRGFVAYAFLNELIGTSSESWERAAAAAVETAAKTLRDLRIAEVVELDLQLEEGRVRAYRARVKVSFKYERGTA